MSEALIGFVDTIVFSEEENGFTVAKLKIPNQPQIVVIVGTMPSLQAGETIRCLGSWQHHPEHGQQFSVSSFEVKIPSDLFGIQKYLESGLIKGIGATYAKRIVDRFGLQTLAILDHHPEQLAKVPGIGKKKIAAFHSQWLQHKAMREVMIFLRKYAISPAIAQKLFRRYGKQCLDKLQQEPFIIARQVAGIGFKTADRIAQSLGIAKDAHQRIEAAILHALWEASREGHVCLPQQELLLQVEQLLQIDPAATAAQIASLLQRQEICKREEILWVRPLFLAEQGIAHSLLRLQQGTSAWRAVDCQKALPWVEKKLGIQLAVQQKEAVCAALSSKTLIITGGPGTGKSTITRAILQISQQLTSDIFLAAPTGRAAKRLSEITGHKASTIHALLEMDFRNKKFKFNRDHPLRCSLLIVDEVSMIDTLLMYHLLKALPTPARLILIGDVDQLPSVGPGNVLRDLIDSGTLPTLCLTEIFRQARGSLIVVNAHRINQGQFPYLQPQARGDFLFIEHEDPRQAQQLILDLVKERLPQKAGFDAIEQIQVLSPMKKGLLGVQELNRCLQSALNASPIALSRMGQDFHVGDKVMQVRNNYQKLVYNGDIGRIAGIDVQEKRLAIAYEQRRVDYALDELDEIQLAYAVSIHKYQGSEAPCIVLPIHMSHYKLLNRNLLYTALTRGKRLVILVGTKKAIAAAVDNDAVEKRYTGLTPLLRETL